MLAGDMVANMTVFEFPPRFSWKEETEKVIFRTFGCILGLDDSLYCFDVNLWGKSSYLLAGSIWQMGINLSFDFLTFCLFSVIQGGKYFLTHTWNR